MDSNICLGTQTVSQLSDKAFISEVRSNLSAMIFKEYPFRYTPTLREAWLAELLEQAINRLDNYVPN